MWHARAAPRPWCARGLVRKCHQRAHAPPLLRAALAQRVAAAATPAASLPQRNEDTTVLVAGPTGYIGRYVTKELISRGYKARGGTLCAFAIAA